MMRRVNFALPMMIAVIMFCAAVGIAVCGTNSVNASPNNMKEYTKITKATYNSKTKKVTITYKAKCTIPKGFIIESWVMQTGSKDAVKSKLKFKKKVAKKETFKRTVKWTKRGKPKIAWAMFYNSKGVEYGWSEDYKIK